MPQTKRSEERRLGEALRTGGQILIDQLVIQGVERVYCVPGESFLAALDAMSDTPIEVTVCRQEAGAAMMALTEGRLTGRPGICFVTRGPGATNAAHGVHIAEHDSAPMILFVGQVERASAAFARFAERFDLPVVGSFRRASAFDGEHDNFAGEIGFSVNPKLKARVEAADLVLLVGGRMSEAAAQGYTLFQIPAPRQRLVHVHADANEIGRNYHPALGIVATSPEFCAALEGVEPPATIRWSAETRAARADYLAWSEQAPPNPGRVQLSEIMFAIRRRSPGGIFTNGAGNFSIWVGRFLRFRRVEQQLGPTSGSMG